MPIFKALHILSMFTMVAVFSGGELFYALAVWGRDVHALAWLQRLRRPLGVAAFGALLAGLAFGLLTAATGGIDFFEGWLIAAYLLIALFFVNGAVFERAVRRLADHAVEADAGQRPVEEVVSEMATFKGGPYSLPSTRSSSPRSSWTWSSSRSEKGIGRRPPRHTQSRIAR